MDTVMMPRIVADRLIEVSEMYAGVLSQVANEEGEAGRFHAAKIATTLELMIREMITAAKESLK